MLSSRQNEIRRQRNGQQSCPIRQQRPRLGSGRSDGQRLPGRTTGAATERIDLFAARTLGRKKGKSWPGQFSPLNTKRSDFPRIKRPNKSTQVKEQEPKPKMGVRPKALTKHSKKKKMAEISEVTARERAKSTKSSDESDSVASVSSSRSADSINTYVKHQAMAKMNRSPIRVEKFFDQSDVSVPLLCFYINCDTIL